MHQAWRDRLRRIARGTGKLAATTASWVALVLVLADDYAVTNLFLVYSWFGDPGTGDNGWHFWFIESLVCLQVGALLLVAVPAVDRLSRRWPFGLPAVLVALCLVTRYELVGGELPTPLVVGWLFALGWAAANAATGWQRLAVTGAVVATVPGFFGDPAREAVIVAGLALLVWVRRLPSLHWLNRVVAGLAASSLYVYITHWQVYPHLYGFSPLLAVLASFGFGIAYAAAVTWVTARLAGPRWRGWMGRWLPTRTDPTR